MTKNIVRQSESDPDISLMPEFKQPKFSPILRNPIFRDFTTQESELLDELHKNATSENPQGRFVAIFVRMLINADRYSSTVRVGDLEHKERLTASVGTEAINAVRCFYGEMPEVSTEDGIVNAVELLDGVGIRLLRAYDGGLDIVKRPPSVENIGRLSLPA